MHNSVQRIADTKLCASCGMCEIICPQNCIKVKETVNGYFSPVIEKEKCNNCGVCFKKCPVTDIIQEIKVDNENLEAFLGRTNDKEIYENGQSGGVLTQFVDYLISEGIVEKALVTEVPKDGTLRPNSFWTSDSKELKRCQGSIYFPNPLCRKIEKEEENRCIIGLPCQLKAINKKYKDYSQPLRLGLFCSGVIGYGALDNIIPHKTGVSNYRCRSKEVYSSGDSFVYNMQEEIKLSAIKFFKQKSIHLPPICTLCSDQLNSECDISFGDAWGFEQKGIRNTVIIVRTEKGKLIWNAFLKSELCKIEKVNNFSIINKGQRIESRIKLSRKAKVIYNSRINYIITGKKKIRISIYKLISKEFIRLFILQLPKNCIFFRLVNWILKKKIKL